jgi:hypothetical protein
LCIPGFFCMCTNFWLFATQHLDCILLL